MIGLFTLEEKIMSESKVDWSRAPLDAEFFAYGEFRKSCSDDYMSLYWQVDRDIDEGYWERGAFTLEECKEASDYEERPASVVKDPLCTPEATPDVTTGAIKSDGGSSSYYDIEIPDWLFDKMLERNYSGNCFIKTEELIEVMGSDFDEGNILKCLVRINSLKKGVGKQGNDVAYDANKIVYSANRLKERDKR